MEVMNVLATKLLSNEDRKGKRDRVGSSYSSCPEDKNKPGPQDSTVQLSPVPRTETHSLCDPSARGLCVHSPKRPHRNNHVIPV